MVAITFKVTRAAGKELRKSMLHHDFDDMPVRIAAQRKPDGSIEYQMGFDEAGPGDVMFSGNGVDVIIAEEHQELLHAAELDYVELDDGDLHFIFKNPNDPTYISPDAVDAADSSNGKPPS